MGFKDPYPTPFNDIFTKISTALEPGIAYAEVVIFDNNEVDIGKNKVIIKGIEFDTGNKVTSNLQGCEEIALFICTLGKEFENNMKLFRTDPVEAYFADTMGSLKCETLADILHGRVLCEVQKTGFTATNRYSPGYCNWNVSEQQKLFSFFKETKTGISLNNSSLMSPIKSISGMIGIGKDVKKIPYTCNVCADINCLYRRKK